jgi:hypothetical protein
MDILHRGPNNREATGFGCKGINLIGTLANIAEKTLNGIGTANIAMHDRREGIKRQSLFEKVMKRPTDVPSTKS